MLWYVFINLFLSNENWSVEKGGKYNKNEDSEGQPYFQVHKLLISWMLVVGLTLSWIWWNEVFKIHISTMMISSSNYDALLVPDHLFFCSPLWVSCSQQTPCFSSNLFICCNANWEYVLYSCLHGILSHLRSYLDFVY